MLNKLLITMLNHKMNKLIINKCKQCTNKGNCYMCDIFYNKQDIKDMIIDLKERRI